MSTPTPHVSHRTELPPPGFFRVILWGLAVVGLAGWVSPSHLLLATSNLGGNLPPWLEWPAWCCVVGAPALEAVVRRRRALVLIPSLCALLLLAVSAVVSLTGSLDSAWPLLALVAMAGSVSSILGWALFVQAVPESRRSTMLFATTLGVGVGTALWTGGFFTTSGVLREYLDWGWVQVWTFLTAAWALVTLGMAGVAHLAVPNDTDQRAYSTTDLTAPFRDAWRAALNLPGLPWVVACQLTYALLDASWTNLFFTGLVAADGKDGSAISNQLLGSGLGFGSVVGLLVFPVTARFGIQRYWRTAVALYAIAPLLLAGNILLGSSHYPLVVLAVGWKGVFGFAMGITWTLYLMRYVSPGRFVLSHFAWLTGLQTALMVGASLVNSHLLVQFGASTTSLWLLGIVPLFVTAGHKMPFPSSVAQSPAPHEASPPAAEPFR